MPRGKYLEGGFCEGRGLLKPGLGHFMVFAGFSDEGTSKIEKPHWRRRASRSASRTLVRKLSNFSGADFSEQETKSRALEASGTRALARFSQRRKVRSLIGCSPSPVEVAHSRALSHPASRASDVISRTEDTVALPRHNSTGGKDLVCLLQKRILRTGKFRYTWPLHRSWIALRG